MKTTHELHQFWFGEIEISKSYYEQKIPWWFFGGDKSLDRVCRKALEQNLHQEERNLNDPRESLIQIILFDQFPRNAYRDSTLAHQWDDKAAFLSLELINKGLDLKLSLPERIFAYMPLEHAENKELQDLSVEKFYELHREAPAEIKEWTRLGLTKAIDHQKTVRTFGRFPARNKKMGRESTPLEKIFLTTTDLH